MPDNKYFVQHRSVAKSLKTGKTLPDTGGLGREVSPLLQLLTGFKQCRSLESSISHTGSPWLDAEVLSCRIEAAGTWPGAEASNHNCSSQCLRGSGTEKGQGLNCLQGLCSFQDASACFFTSFLLQPILRTIVNGKVAIITGASSGIGKAIAERFSKEGAIVIIAARSNDGKKVEKQLTSKGKKAMFIKTDVSDAKSVREMTEKTIKTFGRIDILINNAGILLHGDVESTSEQDWDKVVDTNLKGIFLCSKYAAPYIKKGAIVNISSEWGLYGGKDVAAYCASKGGVVNLTKAMALDYARKGIRVNAVCPGPIMTKMLTGLFTKQQLKQLAEMIPMGKIGRPEEVANLVYFLASEQASYITGGIYTADGGDTAGTY